MAMKFKIPDFIPNAEKAKSIASQVDKTEENKEENKQEEEPENKMLLNEGEELMKELVVYSKDIGNYNKILYRP